MYIHVVNVYGVDDIKTVIYVQHKLTSVGMVYAWFVVSIRTLGVMYARPSLFLCMCAFARASACACVWVWVCIRVCVCVRARACTNGRSEASDAGRGGCTGRETKPDAT